MRFFNFAAILFLSFFIVGCASKVPVRINTIPAEATIHESVIDMTWNSGGIVELPYRDGGYYNITVSKDGYADILKSFKIDKDGIYHTFKLHKLYTTLKLNIEPSNTITHVKCGNLEFTGNKIIQIPDSAFLKSDTLVCVLKASSAGYKSLNKNLIITKFTNVVASDILEESKIVLEFNSEPSFAEVYENSLGYLGSTPFIYELKANQMQGISTYTSEGQLDKTRLNLIFKKDGYLEQEKSIWLKKNQKNRVNLIMIKSKQKGK